MHIIESSFDLVFLRVAKDFYIKPICNERPNQVVSIHQLANTP